MLREKEHIKIQKVSNPTNINIRIRRLLLCQVTRGQLAQLFGSVTVTLALWISHIIIRLANDQGVSA